MLIAMAKPTALDPQGQAVCVALQQDLVAFRQAGCVSGSVLEFEELPLSLSCSFAGCKPIAACDRKLFQLN